MIDNLTKILREEDLGSVVAASVVIDHQKVPDQDELKRLIRVSNCQVGWLCLTDEVVVIRTSQDLERIAGRIILYGELVAGPISLHIRQEADSWYVYTYTKQNGGGIMMEELFAPIPLAGGMWLQYETFWKEVGGMLSPHASRFAGFKVDVEQGEEVRS